MPTDSKDSRTSGTDTQTWDELLEKLADLVAYATWRKYEFLDGRLFESYLASV
jgi:hypothetical protein